MNEYKRLTNNNLEEYDPEYDFCIECKYFGEPNGCNRPNGTCDNYDRFIEMYTRLTELEDQGKKIEEMENFIIKTRNILRNILLTNSKPIKNTSKKDCYFCLTKLQELYKSNNSISDEDFLETLFKTKTPEDRVALSKEEFSKALTDNFNMGKKEAQFYSERVAIPTTRKETVREILNAVDNESNGQTISITNYLRKKYGVEVEE